MDKAYNGHYMYMITVFLLHVQTVFPWAANWLTCR